VLDLWFERVVKSRLRVEARLVRYIDDFVSCFQFREDALRVQDALCKRLRKFSLTLGPSKVVEFGRFAQRQAAGAVKRLLKSVVRENRSLRSVGTGGGRPPGDPVGSKARRPSTRSAEKGAALCAQPHRRFTSLSETVAQPGANRDGVEAEGLAVSIAFVLYVHLLVREAVVEHFDA
jgi:hypothetical protein